MRTVTFQSVFESVLSRHGLDPFGDAITHDTARAVARHITERAETAWMLWRWPDLTKTEERAYRQVWNATVQYRKINEDGLSDEVYYLQDQKYYKVKPATLGGPVLADPIPGTLPTDTTYFIPLDPVTTFVGRDQPYKPPLGQVIGVYGSNPSLNGCCSQSCLDFSPSEKGIKICCGPPTTVFIQHLLGEPEYTMTPYISGKAYVPGDIVFYPVTGDCYRCIADNTSHIPTENGFWILVPVPAMFSTFLKEGAYADSLMETFASGEDQIRLARASAANTKADESIEGLIDDLLEQGQKFHYVHPQGVRRTWTYDGTLWWSQQCGRLCHSEPWSGDIVHPLTDALDTSYVPGSPPPEPSSDILINTQSGIMQLVSGQGYIDVVFPAHQPTSTWTFIESEIVNTLDSSPLNIWPGIVTSKTRSGFRLQLNGIPNTDHYYLHWTIAGPNAGAGEANTYVLLGPASGPLDAPSTFAVSLPAGTSVSDPVTVTPGDGGDGGTFIPTSVTLTTEVPSASFSYSPDSYGTKTISVTNDVGLIDPASVSFGVVVGTYSLSGPSSGTSGVASTNFTVALPVGGVTLSTITVTPGDSAGGGTFTPTTVNLTTGAPSATFTYTPVTGGAKTISVTNNRGLTNPGNLTYTSIATLADGDPVSSWADSSGNGHNATMTGTNRPIFKTAILGGKPVVRFTTAGVSKLNLVSNIPGTTSFTCFAVMKATGPTVALYSLGGSGAGGFPLGVFENTDGHTYVANRAGYNAIPLDETGAFRVFSADADTGLTFHMFVDGTSAAAAGAGVANTGDFVSIGWNSVSSLYSDGDVAEIIFYNVILSSTNRANIEKYLGTKYGITVAGGTAVDPSTVTGLVGWWKTDSGVT